MKTKKIFLYGFILAELMVIGFFSCVKEREPDHESLFPNLILKGHLERPGLGEQGREGYFPEGIAPSETFFVNASAFPGSGQTFFAYDTENILLGRSFIFEVFLKRDHNIEGVYPSVCWGNYRQELSDFWAQGKWKKLSLVIPFTELNQNSYHPLSIKIPKDDYNLWMRDASLREVRIVFTAPKDQTSVRRKTIRFAWMLPETDRLLNISFRFSRDPRFPEGTTQIFETDNRKSELVIPNTFDRGRWYWKADVYLYKAYLASSETRSFQVKRAFPDMRARSPESETIINIEAFPIGIFNVRADDFPEIKAAGFDAVTVHPLDAGDLEVILRGAERNNLKLMIPFSMPEKYNINWEPHGKNILGWYLADEPEGHSLSPKIVRQRRDNLREKDLKQLGAIALCRSWRAADYWAATDVVMSDQYPVPFNPLSWLSESLDEARFAAGDEANKKVWAVIQAFDWGEIRDVREMREARPPSAIEIKALTYLALVHEAHGIFFYSYRRGETRLKEKAVLWGAVRETVGELKKLLPVWKDDTVHLSIPFECSDTDEWDIPAVHYVMKKVKEADGPHRLPAGYYLAAVNTMGRKVKAAFGFPEDLLGESMRLIDVFSGDVIFVREGGFSYRFEPYERKVWLLGE
ncbi:MAG: hypothetical protein JXB26_14665 [Candidatus Aminicenantes bacterium]|nr:hypothetical protein [Candidatus Aminicenantes bacterium]